MSTTSKQDRQGARTPADLERKYDFSAMGERFAEVIGIALDAQTHVKELDDDINSAEFVIGVINGESTAKISADRLDIFGKVLNIKVDATNIDGKVIADQIEVEDLSALGATIGGWDIEEGGISKTKTSDTDNTDVSICEVGIFPPDDFELTEIPTNKIFYVRNAYEVEGTLDYESYLFYVQADGYLHSEYGDIGGWAINPSSLSGSYAGMLGETYETQLSPSALKFSETAKNGKETSVELTSNGIDLHKESLYGVTDKFPFLTLYLADGVGVTLYVDQYGAVSGAPFGGVVPI